MKLVSEGSSRSSWNKVRAICKQVHPPKLMLATIITLALFKSPSFKIIDTLYMLHFKYFFYHFQEYFPFPSSYFYPQPCDLTSSDPLWSYFFAGPEFWPICSGFFWFVCFVFLEESHTLTLNFVSYFQHYLSSITCISKKNWSPGCSWNQEGWPRTGTGLFYSVDTEPLSSVLLNKL